MSFLETVPPDQATGDLAGIYSRLEESLGYVPNYALAFSLRPEVYSAWGQLIRTVAGGMDPRRYELATMGAALTLRSSYCSLAHGEKLMGLGASEDEVRSLTRDGFGDELSDQDRAIVEFAGKVARAATDIDQLDVSRLREVGLTDQEIFDVAAAAAARCFFSKMLDATGTSPDSVYRESIPGLIADLTVGRPIES